MMVCGQRFGSSPNDPATDEWRLDGTCSWCGSQHPDVVLEKLEFQEWEIIPTDKNYKAYVHPLNSPGSQLKFYYTHFSPEQMNKFIELYNKRLMKIGYPGHFYNPPFFMQFKSP